MTIEMVVPAMFLIILAFSHARLEKRVDKLEENRIVKDDD